MYRYIFYFTALKQSQRVNASVRWDSPKAFASVDDAQRATAKLIEANNGLTDVRFSRIEIV